MFSLLFSSSVLFLISIQGSVRICFSVFVWVDINFPAPFNGLVCFVHFPFCFRHPCLFLFCTSTCIRLQLVFAFLSLSLSSFMSPLRVFYYILSFALFIICAYFFVHLRFCSFFFFLGFVSVTIYASLFDIFAAFFYLLAHLFLFLVFFFIFIRSNLFLFPLCVKMPMSWFFIFTTCLISLLLSFCSYLFVFVSSTCSLSRCA